MLNVSSPFENSEISEKLNAFCSTIQNIGEVECSQTNTKTIDSEANYTWNLQYKINETKFTIIDINFNDVYSEIPTLMSNLETEINGFPVSKHRQQQQKTLFILRRGVHAKVLRYKLNFVFLPRAILKKK